MSAATALPQVCAQFESLTAESLPQLMEHYAPDAYFKDPFNMVQGKHAIETIFAHMFATLDTPRFAILETICSEDQAFLTWDFTFRLRGNPDPWKIHGSSHLHFLPDGKIIRHRDYWDTAEELYEKLPVLGALLRLLKARLRTPDAA